jgi:hypothetical protein
MKNTICQTLQENGLSLYQDQSSENDLPTTKIAKCCCCVSQQHHVLFKKPFKLSILLDHCGKKTFLGTKIKVIILPVLTREHYTSLLHWV